MSIIVFSENRNAKIKKSSFEAISYAVNIAKNTQQSVVAISIGNLPNEQLALLAKYGANKIISINSPEWETHDSQTYTKLFEELAIKENANTFIFANSNIGKAIAPRLAVRLKAALISGIVSIPSSYSPLVFNRKSFNGAAYQNVQVNSQNAVLTINPNATVITENQQEINIEDYCPKTNAIGKTKIISKDIASGKIVLTEANIVVSGGRGLKSGDNWGQIEELAEILGAGLACSRPVSDEGWRSHEEHVGQTGKIIAPDLYIAIGISGAIQHIGGVSASKVIVAIDKDKDAPIFKYANYGIIADAFVVLPKLIESAKKFKTA